MPNYRYKARDRSGALFVGTFESANDTGVAGHLTRLGYTPVSIIEEAKGGTAALLSYRFDRVRQEEVIILSRQLLTLINAGIPFIGIFSSLADQTENPALKKVIVEIRKDVEKGGTIADAFEKHPKIFSPLYVNMIRAGEASGMLDVMLERLVMLAEHDAETRARIKAAVRYPLIVVVALIAAFVIVVMFVIPRFASLYDSFDVELPFPTRVMIAINTIAQNYGIFVALAVILSVIGVKRYIQTVTGRLWWDSFKLKIPIFGPIFTKTALSRFARVFGVLTRSGLPILKTLEIVAETVGNKFLSRIVLSLRDSARQGQGISQPLKASGVFPPLVLQMVGVGEETGSMEEMMIKVSEYYDREVEYAIKNLATSLEPIILTVIGGAVLFLALAIFLPWWNLINVVKGGS